MTESLTIALKEWDLQIQQMLAGRQLFLLRKGGILESNNQFELEHPRFLFFPTFIHQDPRMVREEFRAGLGSIREEPAKIDIPGYGEAVEVFEIPQENGRARLEQLADLYIWDAPLLDMRFAYRPEKPLYLVLVRAFALATPVTIRNTLDYAGCKSWVPLEQPIPLQGARPAVSEERLQSIAQRVRKTFA